MMLPLLMFVLGLLLGLGLYYLYATLPYRQNKLVPTVLILVVLALLLGLVVYSSVSLLQNHPVLVLTGLLIGLLVYYVYDKKPVW